MSIVQTSMLPYRQEMKENGKPCNSRKMEENLAWSETCGFTEVGYDGSHQHEWDLERFFSIKTIKIIHYDYLFAIKTVSCVPIWWLCLSLLIKSQLEKLDHDVMGGRWDWIKSTRWHEGQRDKVKKGIKSVCLTLQLVPAKKSFLFALNISLNNAA